MRQKIYTKSCKHNIFWHVYAWFTNIVNDSASLHRLIKIQPNFISLIGYVIRRQTIYASSEWCRFSKLPQLLHVFTFQNIKSHLDLCMYLLIWKFRWVDWQAFEVWLLRQIFQAVLLTFFGGLDFRFFAQMLEGCLLWLQNM